LREDIPFKSSDLKSDSFFGDGEEEEGGIEEGLKFDLIIREKGGGGERRFEGESRGDEVFSGIKRGERMMNDIVCFMFLGRFGRPVVRRKGVHRRGGRGGGKMVITHEGRRECLVVWARV